LKSSTIYIPRGTYRITNAIRLRNTVSLEGVSRGSGATAGTEILCDFVDFTPPSDIYNNVNNDWGHYHVVLDKKPMIYNVELLTQERISNIRFNGNKKEVYGVFFNEMYYFNIDNVNIINCNHAPFTLVYSQFNSIKLLSCIANGGAVRILGCSTTTIDGLDIESCFSPSSVLDIVHSISTKAGVMVNNFHYEESAGSTPAGDFIKIAQRGAGIRDMFANFTGTEERFIHLLDVESDYYFDGNTIKTVTNSHVQLINLSNTGGNVKVKLGVGTNSSTIETGGLIVSETENTDNNLTSSGVMRFFKVITSSMYKMLWFSDDNTINFFDNLNRRIRQVNADMHLENSYGRMVLRSGFDGGSSTVETNATMLDIRKKDASTGDFSEGLLKLSGHYLWVDTTGILRISKTFPISDDDGNIVGMQNE